jgi:hypothetical protein
VSCSIVDLARYAADHLNGLKGRPALLSPATYVHLHSTVDGSVKGFTSGWGVDQHARWGEMHFGAGSGGRYFARVALLPKVDLAIVVLANSGDAAKATRDVIERLAEQFGGSS